MQRALTLMCRFMWGDGWSHPVRNHHRCIATSREPSNQGGQGNRIGQHCGRLRIPLLLVILDETCADPLDDFVEGDEVKLQRSS